MKVIDAFWEKRNLGVNCVEVELGESDIILEKEKLVNDIKDAFESLNAQYAVIKVGTGFPGILHVLQNNSFNLVECQIRLKYKIEENFPNFKKFRNMFTNINSIKISNTSNIQILKERIEEGIFVTDRIALDNKFNKSIANKRYANWVEDEYNKGTDIYTVFCEDKEIGFFMTRNMDTKEHEYLLGGLYLSYQHKGLGLSWSYSILETSIRRGAKHINTSVSSNNLKALKLYECLGAKVEDIKYVFVKHL